MSAFWTNALFDILLVIYVLDCIFIGLCIMMQRSKQEGLGAAFGGALMQEFAGAHASRVLEKATVYAAIIFFVLSIVLARLSAHSAALGQGSSGVLQELEKSSMTAPASTNAAPMSAPAPVAPADTTVKSVTPLPMSAPATNAPAKTGTH